MLVKEIFSLMMELNVSHVLLLVNGVIPFPQLIAQLVLMNIGYLQERNVFLVNLVVNIALEQKLIVQNVLMDISCTPMELLVRFVYPLVQLVLSVL